MNPTFHPGWNYTIKILDFVDNSMGIFHSSGMVTYYLFVKDRHGVLHIQSEDSQDSIGKQQANNRRTAAEQQQNTRRTTGEQENVGIRELILRMDNGMMMLQ